MLYNSNNNNNKIIQSRAKLANGKLEFCNTTAKLIPRRGETVLNTTVTLLVLPDRTERRLKENRRKIILY